MGGQRLRGSAAGDLLILRLARVDAPHLGQICGRGPRRWRCGDAARDAVRLLLSGVRIECTTPLIPVLRPAQIAGDALAHFPAADPDLAGIPYAAPAHAVRCSIPSHGDLGAYLITLGWALPRGGGADPAGPAAAAVDAQQRRVGLWQHGLDAGPRLAPAVSLAAVRVRLSGATEARAAYLARPPRPPRETLERDPLSLEDELRRGLD